MTTKKKILNGIIIAVIAVAVLRTLARIGLIGIMLIGSALSKPEVYNDIESYTEYMSFEAQNSDSKWNKWGMDESIWPSKIDDVSDVVDYKMVYYNPWDAQYLGYLVIDYTPDDYASEITRLKEYPSTDYIGYYSVIEEKSYELLAIYADEYNGFVKNKFNENIYVDDDGSIQKCDYLNGFGIRPVFTLKSNISSLSGDGTKDNPYRKIMVNE